MRILVGISHPKHVYMFINLIKQMEIKGHEFKIVVVEKEITGYLLEQLNIPYELIGKNQPTLVKKILNLLMWEYRTLKISFQFNPDIFIGQALPHLAHVSAILNKPFIVFEDTEIAKKLHRFVLPFADAVITPECFKNDLGKKQLRFNGFFELAYLHPNYFKPDLSILDDLGLSKNDKYIVIRFVSWHAYHDIGKRGMSLKVIKKIINELEKHAKIYITSENALPNEFKKYELKISPIKMHDLLYYSMMYIGEGGSMASESGILGTPSLYISPLVGTMGNFEELEKKYGLLYSFNCLEDALDKLLELLDDKNLKNKWQKKREKLFNETIDVTKFMIEIIEKYKIQM